MDDLDISLAGINLAGLTAGEGGRPLLLLHGFTGCKEDFADEVIPLAEIGFHVVAPDLRGHGRSDQPSDEAAYNLASFAADAFALVDHLGWDTFDLVGHSMGGMVAQLMVLERPGRIGRLVLMDTHHGRVEGLDLDLVALGIELARTEGLGVIQELLAAGANPLDNPAYERLCAERPGYREWAESKMLACSAAMYAAMLTELTTVTDRLDALRSLDAPTLVLVGELDAAFRSAADRLADAVPGARLVVVPGGGHSPQFEATTAWRNAVHSFLREGAA